MTAHKHSEIKMSNLPLRLVFLALVGMALALPSLAQRTKDWKPSPADHGIILPQDGKKHGHTIEAPQPNSPADDDPNAGDIPDDPENEDETDPSNDEQKQPTDIHVSPIATLAIMKVELFTIGIGSDIGKPGDKALMITGQGFADSESSPIVHLGKQILDQVYVSEAGKVLIALLPAALANDLPLQDFEDLAVQNPGGMNRDPQRWAHFPLRKSQFLQELQSAVEAHFKRGPFFVQRVR